MTYINRTWIW